MPRKRAKRTDEAAALLTLIEQAADQIPSADDPETEEEALMQARDAAIELDSLLRTSPPVTLTTEQARTVVYALDCAACTALAYLRGER